MSRSREEAIRLGIKVFPIKHRKTRRAEWHDYWKAGVYGITIHLFEDEEGGVERCMLLSEVVGEVQIPRSRTNASDIPLDNNSRGASNAASDDPCLGARVVLSDLGRLVDQKVHELGTHTREDGISVGPYVLMPTHIHLTMTLAQDLPLYMHGGKERHWTLGDVMCGFEKGCTSWWWRYLEGESVEEIIANPTRRRTSSSPPSLGVKDGTPRPAPSLWHKDGFNDQILYRLERRENWMQYVHRNAYYWRLHDLYPKLFEHELHIMAGGADYTAYGCMWLLERAGKVQVKCHRLARRGMLTEREWQLATQDWKSIRAFEAHAKAKKLGRYDRDWYRSSNPDTITAIDYTRTEAFRKQKADLLRQCEDENAVLVSPAVSPGEHDIFYSALEMGYPCIKLVKDPIPEKGHAVTGDVDFCACGQLLVLGPWEVTVRAITDGSVVARPMTDEGFWHSLYAKFHNLNDMAADLCIGTRDVVFDMEDLEKCK